MAIRIKIVQVNELLEVIVGGEYDVEEALDRFPLVLEASRLADTSKILIDFSGLRDFPSVEEDAAYTMGVLSHYRQYRMSGGRELMIAYLGTSSLMKSWTPGPDIVKKEGVDIELFTDRNKAFAWLGLDPI